MEHVVIPIVEKYKELFESQKDIFKYNKLNKVFDSHSKDIIDFYQKVFESLYKDKLNENYSFRTTIGTFDDDYVHLSGVPVLFLAKMGDEAAYQNIHNHKSIIIPTPSKLYRLAEDFKKEYLDTVKIIFPDVDPEIAYEYLEVPGQLAQYEFEDGSNLFRAYYEIYKKYKEKVEEMVNTTTRGILVHEIVHAIDDSDFTFSGSGVDTKYQYYNSPHERNAYIVGLMSQFGTDKKFRDILDFPNIKNYLDNLSHSNRKRVTKRLYSIWSEMTGK